MASLFWKEYHQGRPLLIFAAVLALFPGIAHYVGMSGRLLDEVARQDLDTLLGWVMLLVPVLLALFAGAGLFSMEADRGTLPALFALPLSRKQIWLAKALGGLALTLSASLLFLCLSALLVPTALPSLPFQAYLPDLFLWMAVAFATALLCSALASSSTSALIGSLLLAGALAAGVTVFWQLACAPLLGYAEALDTALWSAAFVPALLLGSLLIITRGELVSARRARGLAARTLLLGGLLTVLLVCGLARVATGYRRSGVEWASVSTWAMGAGPGRVLTAVPVDAAGSRVPLERRGKTGWAPVPAPINEYQLGQDPRLIFRRTYQVVVDPRSGRELLVTRTPGTHSGPCAISPDGRYAAAVVPTGALTWAMRDMMVPGPFRRFPLHLVDLRTGRSVFSRTFAGVPQQVQWSPSGRYLSVQFILGNEISLHFLTSRGAPAGEVPVHLTWMAWSSTEDVLYGTDGKGHLLRLRPGAAQPETVWTAPEGFARYLWGWGQAISPDGRWMLLNSRWSDPAHGVDPQTGQVLSSPSTPPQLQARWWLVRSDGSQVMPLWQEATYDFRRPHATAWSRDGKILYLYDGEFRRWREGLPSPEPTGLRLPIGHLSVYQLVARPGNDELVIWLTTGDPWNEIQKVGQTKVLLLDPTTSRLRVSPAGPHIGDAVPIGFDPDGRVLLARLRGLYP